MPLSSRSVCTSVPYSPGSADGDHWHEHRGQDAGGALLKHLSLSEGVVARERAGLGG